MYKMTTLLLGVAAASMAGPARAFDGQAPAAPATPKADELAAAQRTLAEAQTAVTAATEAEVNAKARLAGAETEAGRADLADDAKAAAAANVKAAKTEVSNAGKALKTAKSNVTKAERAVAKAQTAATKESERLAKDAEKAQRAQQTEAAKAKQPSQNGITRPKPGGVTAQAWDIFDRISAERKSPASIGEALPIAQAQGLNPNMVRSQYASWRKFNGVTGRIAAPTPPAPPAPPAAPAVPAAPAAQVPPAPPVPVG